MRFTIDSNEIAHIGISMLVVALAFSFRYLLISKELFLSFLPIILVGVGTGFIFHELAHKFTAMRFGAYARYRAWESGLAFALILSIVTRGAFVFAAPGAVYIYSHNLTRFQNGIISIAGPLTNLVTGSVFTFLLLFAPTPYFALLFASAASINFFLGFFNMLPIPPLDGSKVLAWNPLAWVATIGVLALLVFVL